MLRTTTILLLRSRSALAPKPLGVRGFTSMFFSNTAGDRQLVYGARPYATFQEKVAELAPRPAGRRIAHYAG